MMFKYKNINVTRNTTPSSVACARAYDAIIAWQRRSRHCGSESIRGADYVSGLGDIVILGEGGQKLGRPAAPVTPALIKGLLK